MQGDNVTRGFGRGSVGMAEDAGVGDVECLVAVVEGGQGAVLAAAAVAAHHRGPEVAATWTGSVLAGARVGVSALAAGVTFSAVMRTLPPFLSTLLILPRKFGDNKILQSHLAYKVIGQ